MKIDKNNPAEMAAAVKRIPLRKVFDACNKKYFFGKLPASIKVRWVTGREPSIGSEGMPEGAHWSKDDREIRLRLSAFCGTHQGYYRFHSVLVHEMIHAYIDLVLKKSEFRLLKDGTKVVSGCTRIVKARVKRGEDRMVQHLGKWIKVRGNRKTYKKIVGGKQVQHGELFGRESRRIAEIDGNPVDLRDCQYGSEGKRWALAHGKIKLADGSVISFADHKRQVWADSNERRKREAERQAWMELWGGWKEQVEQEAQLGAEQFFEGDNYSTTHDDEEYPFDWSQRHSEIVLIWKQQLAKKEQEAKRHLKAELFRARLAAIPIEVKLEQLSRQGP
jgi:hypothetical protein